MMNEQVMIPYAALDGEMYRMERANKRLWIIILVLIVALVGTNIGWLVYENGFEDVVTTVEQEVEAGEGLAIVSGTGDAIYGQSDPKGDGAEACPGQ